jgi:hypothetical protein
MRFTRKEQRQYRNHDNHITYSTKVLIESNVGEAHSIGRKAGNL